jgi:hypothetical protein
MVKSLKLLNRSVKKLRRKRADDFSVSSDESVSDDSDGDALEDFVKARARGGRCGVKELKHPHQGLAVVPTSSYVLSSAKRGLGLEFINKITLRGHQTAIHWFEQLKIPTEVHVLSKASFRFHCHQLDQLLVLDQVVAMALSLESSVLEDLGRKLNALHGVCMAGLKWDRVNVLLPDEARLPGTFNSATELRVLREMNKISKIEGKPVLGGGKG